MRTVAIYECIARACNVWFGLLPRRPKLATSGPRSGSRQVMKARRGPDAALTWMTWRASQPKLVTSGPKSGPRQGLKARRGPDVALTLHMQRWSAAPCVLLGSSPAQDSRLEGQAMLRLCNIVDSATGQAKFAKTCPSQGQV